MSFSYSQYSIHLHSFVVTSYFPATQTVFECPISFEPNFVYTSPVLVTPSLTPLGQFNLYIQSLLQQPKNPEIAEFISLLTEDEKWHIASRLSKTVTQRDCDFVLGVLEIEKMIQDLLKINFAEEVFLYLILTEKISVHTGSNLLLQNYNFKAMNQPVFVLSPGKEIGHWPLLWDATRFYLPQRLANIFYSKIAALPPADRLISLSPSFAKDRSTLAGAIAESPIALWLRPIEPDSSIFQHWVVSPKIAECLFEILYGKNTMYMQPVFGSALSPPEKFKNPDKRHTLIPTTFCTPVEKIHGLTGPDKLHVYFHDLLHLYIEGQNPHRKAWITLAQGFEEIMLSSDCDPYLPLLRDKLLDRNIRYERMEVFRQNRLKKILKKVTLPSEIKFLVLLQMFHDEVFLKLSSLVPESFNAAIFCGMKKIQDERVDNLNFTADLANWFNRDCVFVRSIVTALNDDKMRAAEEGLVS